MAKRPTRTHSDFPIAQAQIDKEIAEAKQMADRDYGKFGWTEPKPAKRIRKAKPKRSPE